jgi:hypothetical protein
MINRDILMVFGKQIVFKLYFQCSLEINVNQEPIRQTDKELLTNNVLQCRAE